MDIVTILDEWKKITLSSPTAYLVREQASKIHLRPELATVISGVRRSGKSTLLGQIVAEKKLPQEHCYFCNFEDPQLAGCLTSKLLDDIVGIATTGSDEKTYFFFDEIQEVQLWQKWLHKVLTNNQNLCFVLTGSNASLLSDELATTITGRHQTVELFPFDWQETSSFLGVDLGLEDFLRTGGFPVAVKDLQPQLYLKELFRNIVLRDIVTRKGGRKSANILRLATMIYESVGSALSFRKAAAACGLTATSAAEYIKALEDAYLIFPCVFFAFSEKKRASHPIKYYPIDPAFRTAVVGNSNRDLGKGLESLVFLYFRRHLIPVYYWKGHGEVDFVVEKGGKIFPIQVTWEEPQERHEKALAEFYHEFPHAEEAVIVNADNLANLIRGELL